MTQLELSLKEKKIKEKPYLRNDGVWVGRVGDDLGGVSRKESVGEHEKVGDSVGGVGAEDEAVGGERRVECVGARRERRPVDGERRPFESVRDHEVVQERRVLLPHRVLFLHLILTSVVLLVRHGSLCSELFPLSLSLSSVFPPNKKGAKHVCERERLPTFIVGDGALSWAGSGPYLFVLCQERASPTQYLKEKKIILIIT